MISTFDINYKSKLLPTKTFKPTTYLQMAAITKMNKSIGEMIKEVETLTISKIKDILVEKLTEEYEPEFVEAVQKVLSEIEIPSYSENIKKPSKKSSDGVEKKKREPTEYNLFLKAKMAEIKEAGTELKGKDLMKAAIVFWNQRKDALAGRRVAETESEPEQEAKKSEPEPEAEQSEPEEKPVVARVTRNKASKGKK